MMTDYRNGSTSLLTRAQREDSRVVLTFYHSKVKVSAVTTLENPAFLSSGLQVFMVRLISVSASSTFLYDFVVFQAD